MKTPKPLKMYLLLKMVILQPAMLVFLGLYDHLVASGMEIQCRGLATRFLVDDDLGFRIVLRLIFLFKKM